MRRETWMETGKIPSGFSQMKLLKENYWYRLLPSQTAQRVCKELQEAYMSWFKLRKTDMGAHPPGFRKKSMLSPLTFYQQFKTDGDTVRFGMGRTFQKETGVKHLAFKLPQWKAIDGVAKAAIILYRDGKWMVHIIYEVPEPPLSGGEEVMAVDLGIINLAVTADTRGSSTVYSGGEALAVQHYFNKEIARVQSQTMKQHGKKHSKALDRMHKRKSRQVNQILHTVSKSIVEEAKQNEVGTIIVGDLKDIRKDKKKGKATNHGKKQNQKLHAWAFSKLTQQITYKAQLSGIQVEVVSEEYTSQTCSICGTVRKSNRKHRGLYVCKQCGTTMNADQNGARNILQKYLQEQNSSKSIGKLTMPSTRRVTNVRPQ